VLLTALILDRLISRGHSQRRGAAQEAGPCADPPASLDGADIPGQTAREGAG
jgi:hypothetical protein